MFFSSSCNARAPQSPLWAGLFILFLAGCGDCAGTVSTGGDSNNASDAHGEQDTGDSKADTGGADAGPGDVDPTDTKQPEECAAENQCASLCCESAQLCLRDQCVLPGAPCAHNLECANTEICEPSIGRCIPDPGVVCEYRPETDIFEPTVTLAWNEPPEEEVALNPAAVSRSEEHTSELQSRPHLVCRLLLEK